jgi:hypothetical protein
VPLPLDESKETDVSRYRMTVVGADVADVVGSAGGWLCDRARAGWDVHVVVADAHDARPLTILGATARELIGELSDAVRAVPNGGTLAISAQVLATDERVREDVVDLVERGVADVTVWGGDWPRNLGREGDRVEHELSPAAQAFKGIAAIALVGASAADPVCPTETLFNLGTESLRRLYAV